MSRAPRLPWRLRWPALLAWLALTVGSVVLGLATGAAVALVATCVLLVVGLVALVSDRGGQW